MEYGSGDLIDEFMDINNSPKEIYEKLSYSISVIFTTNNCHRHHLDRDKSHISKVNIKLKGIV